MRLPNGFGSVYKLSGNRRRPFVVKKTINGKQRPRYIHPSNQRANIKLLDPF